MKSRSGQIPEDDPIYDALCLLLDEATAAAKENNLRRAEKIMKRVHDIAKRLPKKDQNENH